MMDTQHDLKALIQDTPLDYDPEFFYQAGEELLPEEKPKNNDMSLKPKNDQKRKMSAQPRGIRVSKADYILLRVMQYSTVLSSVLLAGYFGLLYISYEISQVFINLPTGCTF